MCKIFLPYHDPWSSSPVLSVQTLMKDRSPRLCWVERRKESTVEERNSGRGFTPLEKRQLYVVGNSFEGENCIG